MFPTSVRPVLFGVLGLAALQTLAGDLVARAPQTATAASGAPADAVEGTRRALIICGHPGDKAHRKPFAETVEKLRESLTTRFGFAAPDVRVQFGGPVAEGEGPVLSGVRGGATKEEIEAEAAYLREHLRPQDTLWVIVIGHSHYDGKHSYFNIPGPDIHEQDFAKLFAGLEAREQAFFITIPASGFYIKPLSAKGRIVMTATEPDLEVNETAFPLALAEVLSAPPPPAEYDADHDARLTMFDLYIAVARNVAQRYVTDELLATEHSLLDDNGDGRGTELQIDYLTVAQGGRAKEGTLPPPVKEGADGALAAATLLPEPPATASQQ
jgi:hypothetical protein